MNYLIVVFLNSLRSRPLTPGLAGRRLSGERPRVRTTGERREIKGGGGGERRCGDLPGIFSLALQTIRLFNWKTCRIKPCYHDCTQYLSGHVLSYTHTLF